MSVRKMFCGSLAMLIAAGSAAAQAPVDPAKPDPPKIVLRGDRFAPLDAANFTPEQKAFVDEVTKGPAPNLGGPYNILLRSPETGRLAHEFGLATRFHSTIPTKLNEMANMMVARFWQAEFVWFAHRRAAQRAGLNPAIGDAILAGKRPVGMAADEEALYNFCDELLNKKQVSDATFAAMKNQVGEQGVVDLISGMGYFQFVSMLLNADRYPLPNGTQPVFGKSGHGPSSHLDVLLWSYFAGAANLLSMKVKGVFHV